MSPDVLLPDEPTNSLDPWMHVLPWTQILQVKPALALNEAGRAIVIATHDPPLLTILADEELLLKVNLIRGHMHFHQKILDIPSAHGL